MFVCGLFVPFALLALSAASNTPPISVRGNAFFAGSTRFYVRGVDYQPGRRFAGNDPALGF